jgi:hypothetical protein
MPLTTDLNTSPFFDDYDPSKEYYRVLFRPATAIQARELNNVQSQIQQQIEVFGNHIFKDGTIVNGCAVTDIRKLPFVYISDAAANGSLVNITSLVGTTVVSNTSNLTARVLTVQPGSTATYPNTGAVYLKYLNTGNTGAIVFANNETITFYNTPRTGNDSIDVVCVTNTYLSNSTTKTTGYAHGITVGDGYIFQKGYFLKVDAQTGIINAYGMDAGNTLVGFSTIETIITPDQDPEINDNALGYSNENAPGAYRLKLTPTITTVASNTANLAQFTPIGQYNYNSLIIKEDTEYNAIGDTMSRYSGETAGDFVIRPFNVDMVTSASGNNQLLEARISPGLGYADGNRIELLKTAFTDVRRGIDQQVALEQQITTAFGNYVLINNVVGDFEFINFEKVDIYDQPQKAIANHNFSDASIVGNNIGHAHVRGWKLLEGMPGHAAALYQLFLFQVYIIPGKSFQNDAKSLVCTSGAAKGIADLVGSNFIETNNKPAYWHFGKTGVVRLTNASNNINTSYISRRKSTGTIQVNGTLTLDITSSGAGGTDVFPYGVGVYRDSVATDFIIVSSAAAATANLTGTVTKTSGSQALIGTGTTFVSDFSWGEFVKVGSDIRSITWVANNTYMYCDAPFSSSLSAQNYTKYFPKGYIFPLYQSMPGNRSVTISSSTAAVINTGIAPTGTIPVTIFYNIKRTNAAPAKKLIKRNRFVAIRPANNDMGMAGPWTLGIPDLHNVQGAYLTSNNTPSTSGYNITNKLIFATGQDDTQYDVSYVSIRPGAEISLDANSMILFQISHFVPDFTSGVGFFSAESYPVDDVNTGNTSAINTAEIPTYTSEVTGATYNLRDVVDFRPYQNQTANNTGDVNMANTAQVTAAVAAATINPSWPEWEVPLSYQVPASGSYFPDASQNMQADITYYVPRRDLVYFTDTGFLRTKEGTAGSNPLPPVIPPSSMTIATLLVRPYPSLTSDQVDVLAQVNRSFVSNVRDVSSLTQVAVVTNRRYTMGDIGQLDKRISRLEYYTSLNLLEQSATALQITDENGLDRFKNGIFADPFTSHALGDVGNPEYRIAIDPIKTIARPFFSRHYINLDWNTGLSSNIQKTGSLLTLPYTEVSVLQQPFATKYRNCAQYAYHWTGVLTLYPTYSNNIDVINRPQIQVTLDNASPWESFANSPLGMNWGDWNTSVAVSSSTDTSTVSTSSSTPPAPAPASPPPPPPTAATATPTSFVADAPAVQQQQTWNADTGGYNISKVTLASAQLGTNQNSYLEAYGTNNPSPGQFAPIPGWQPPTADIGTVFDGTIWGPLFGTGYGTSTGGLLIF